MNPLRTGLRAGIALAAFNLLMAVIKRLLPFGELLSWTADSIVIGAAFVIGLIGGSLYTVFLPRFGGADVVSARVKAGALAGAIAVAPLTAFIRALRSDSYRDVGWVWLFSLVLSAAIGSVVGAFFGYNAKPPRHLLNVTDDAA